MSKKVALLTLCSAIAASLAFASSANSDIQLGALADQSDSGITLNQANLNVNADGRGWAGGHFTVANHSSKNLTTFMVTFSVTDTHGTVLQFSNFVDGFLTQSAVAAGASLDLITYTTGSLQSPVASISASLSYLEFADGTRSGKEAATLYAKLAKERAQAIHYAQTLATRLDQGSPVGEALASSVSDDPGVQTLKMNLRNTMQQNGAATVSEEVHRIANLSSRTP